MPRIEDIFPPVEALLELEPEEVALFVLQYLCKAEDENSGDPPTGTGRYAFINRYGPFLQEHAPEHAEEVLHLLSAAWAWLQKEILVAQRIDRESRIVVTPRGRMLADKARLDEYRRSSCLRQDALDDVLAAKVWPAFIRGGYAPAIFEAFKEVEVRVRRAGGFPRGLLGVKLVGEAFKPGSGPLADKSLPTQEQEAMMQLFRGSIGLFKNPGSHRDVDLDNPSEAAELILLANHLLRIVDRTSVAQPPPNA